MNETLDADRVLAAKGKSFHWARQLLGTRHAQRATRLYRFCRYVDDLADEEHSNERSKKNIAALRYAIQSESSTNPIVVDAIKLINECHIDKNAALDLIAGVESDTELVRIVDNAQLTQYCYHVAGTVGLMMCRVLDTNEPEAEPFAIDLGIAMQLTNICRDVQADALADRRYIPSTMVSAIAPSELVEPSEANKRLVTRAVATLLKSAEDYYRSGERGLSYLPLRARLSILIAARLYREIGQKLKQQHYEYWHGRVVVSKTRKFIITIQILFSAPFKLGFWRRPRRHDDKLHASLSSGTAQKSLSLQDHVH